MKTRSFLILAFIPFLFSALPAQTNSPTTTETVKPPRFPKKSVYPDQADRPGSRSAPIFRQIDTRTPFILIGGFDDLPALPLGNVRVFDGDKEFRRAVGEEKLIVWPIGRFSSDALPKNEQQFRETLRAHAAAFGADFVVVSTAPAEIKRYFQSQFDDLVYCAQAYKRVTAQVGIELDQAAGSEKILKISGFSEGSKAKEGGLRVGDVVRQVDGVEVMTNPQLYWSKAVHWKAGQAVKVQVERDGQIRQFDVILTAA